MSRNLLISNTKPISLTLNKVFNDNVIVIPQQDPLQGIVVDL